MVRVHALCGGYLDLDQTIFFPDRPPGTRWTVPIPCWLVAHPRGRLLFDTGIHRDASVDPVGRLGERRARRFGIRSGPADEVVSQLAVVGLSPGDVTFVANSHLHFDHCGGNEFFPSSTFLVQRAEMDAARRVLGGEAMRYTPSAIDFDHPLDYQLVDGEHDLFGDGQVVLLPTYGHTPGHQSLLVRLKEKGPVVLVGDAVHFHENYQSDGVPGFNYDRAETIASIERIKQIEKNLKATVIIQHDPRDIDKLPAFPAAAN